MAMPIVGVLSPSYGPSVVEESEIPKQWVAIASELEPEVVRAHRSERRAVYERASTRVGRSVQTLRRMVKAYQYARDDVGKAGLSFGQLSAPVGCVEVLARLDELPSRPDAEFRRDVYLGRIPFTALLERERSARRRDDGDVWGVAEWPAFAAALHPELASDPRSVDVTLFQPGKRVHGETGRLLDTDWEFEDGSCRSGVFLSPQCTFSRGRRRPLSERVVKAAAATFYYDRLFFLAWDDGEKEVVDGHVASIGRRQPVPVVVRSMAEMKFVMSNRSALRTPAPPGGPKIPEEAEDG